MEGYLQSIKDSSYLNVRGIIGPQNLIAVNKIIPLIGRISKLRSVSLTLYYALFLVYFVFGPRGD